MAKDMEDRGANTNMAESMGKKECDYTSESIMKEVKRKTSDMTDFQNMSRKYRTPKIMDKTGWKLREENKKMMKGK